jgi:tetratricopeptide (TPR) repeat protein
VKFTHSHIACLALVLMVFLVYGQVVTHDFVNYDDTVYITENPVVQEGLNRENVVWAFTTTAAANWHPLTWLSHLLDVELFGLEARYHLLGNVLLHAVNSCLLFLLLRRMTGAVWRSALVAALFAVHPLHVESVAWISERKDVLSTLFWMLTMGAYVSYTRKTKAGSYILVVLCLTAGLLAKAMLVTLPFLLLLLDFWPLGRWGRVRPALLLAEKVPLMALSVGLSALTLVAQHRGGAVKSDQAFPLLQRLANAPVSYVTYLAKTVWPADLAVLYPHPGGSLPSWKVIASALLIAAVTAAAISVARKMPWVGVGWFWYLGTLVPVIGVIQVGTQAMADRYTYVPLVGVFIAAAWSLPTPSEGGSFRKAGAAGILTLVLGSLGVAAAVQVSFWKNSIVLMQRAIEVSPRNSVAHNHLGIALREEGRVEEAIAHYREALRINPGHVNAAYNLGLALLDQGREEEAAAYTRRALRITPDDGDAHENLGVALARLGEMDEAIRHLEDAIRLDPGNSIFRNNLALALVDAGRTGGGAILKNLGARPDVRADVHYRAGMIHLERDDIDGAQEYFREALAIDPGHSRADAELKRVILQRGP